MDKSSAGLCLIILSVFVGIATGDDNGNTKQHCQFIEITNTWWHRSLEGVYIMKSPSSYNCNNRSVYQLDKEDAFLFYIIQGSWQGWMVGKYECVNKGYLSVSDKAYYPDDIKATWEEFNSLKWLFNKDIISGCHIPGYVRPPRMKTKPPKTQNTTLTTESLENVTQGSPRVAASRDHDFTDLGSVLSLVLYVVIPVGGLVILVLLIVLIVLSANNKYFMKSLQKQQQQQKIDMVAYDGKRVSFNQSGSKIHTDIVPEPNTRQGDNDSVFEVLSDPEDARITPPSLPPYRERQDA